MSILYKNARNVRSCRINQYTLGTLQALTMSMITLQTYWNNLKVNCNSLLGNKEITQPHGCYSFQNEKIFHLVFAFLLQKKILRLSRMDDIRIGPCDELKTKPFSVEDQCQSSLNFSVEVHPDESKQ